MGGGGYDAKGNLVDDGLRGFTYDIENRLTSVVTTPGQSLGLSYDPAGRIQGYASTTGGPTTTSTFLYEGSRLIAEYSASGTLLRRYIHGPGTNEPIVWEEGATNTDRRWLHADACGSVIAQSDGGGNVTATYSYDAYGIPASWGGSRFRYTGQITLPEAQLYHYKARAYDPAMGWFLQTDPIGYDGGINLYQYVGGDPVNMIDWNGLLPGQYYKTFNAAAWRAESDINALSIDQSLEYAGRVYQNPSTGLYSYTQPRSGTTNRSDFGPVPPGMSLVGDYHTHASEWAPAPGAWSKLGEQLSGQDIKTCSADGVPCVLGTPTGVVFSFDPGTGSTTQLGNGLVPADQDTRQLPPAPANPNAPQSRLPFNGNADAVSSNDNGLTNANPAK